MDKIKLSNLMSRDGRECLVSSGYLVIINQNTNQVFCEDINQLAYNRYTNVITDIQDIQDWFNLEVTDITFEIEAEYGTSRQVIYIK